MVDIEIMKKLLVDDLFSPISEKDGRSFARLKESGIDARLRRVDIYDVSEDSLLIKLDKYDQPKSLFKGTEGERKRCDYVLITSINSQSYLLFIEMKSKRVKPSEFIKQFKGAECLMDYCDATLKRFHEQNNFFEGFKKRFVVFYKIPLSKQRTRSIDSFGNNSTPDKALTYLSPHNPSLEKLV